MFGLSISEIFIIALIALILFGNEKLPENLKKFAHGFSKAKSFFFDVNHSWNEIKTDIKKNIIFDDETAKLKELTKPIEIVSQEEIDSITQNYSQETKQLEETK